MHSVSPAGLYPDGRPYHVSVDDDVFVVAVDGGGYADADGDLLNSQVGEANPLDLRAARVVADGVGVLLERRGAGDRESLDGDV